MMQNQFEMNLVFSLLSSFIRKEAMLEDEIHPVQWDTFQRIVKEKRIAPFIHLALKHNPQLDIPVGIQKTFESIYYHNIKRNIALSNALRAMIVAFRNTHLDLLPFKGLILSDYLYHTSVFRNIADLDFLIKWNQYDEVIQLLGSMGYEHHYESGEEQRELHFHFRSSTELYHKTSRLLIEPHWRIFDGYFPEPAANAELFERAADYQFDGISTKNLDDYSLLLLLCIHPARHNWDNLVSWIDLAQFVVNHSELDWGWMLARVKKDGALGMVTTSMKLIKTAFKLKLPADIEPFLVNSSRRLAAVFTEAQHGSPLQPDYLSYTKMFLLNLRLRKRLQEKFKFIKYMLSPKRPELQRISLPRPLFFLYYIIRFFRIMKLALSSALNIGRIFAQAIASCLLLLLSDYPGY